MTGGNVDVVEQGRAFLGQLDYMGTYVGEYVSDLQLIYKRTGLQDATLKRPTTAVLTVHAYGEVRKVLMVNKNGTYRISYEQ